jgi:RecB family exonuclease
VVGKAVHAALETFFGLAVEHRDRERLGICLRATWRRHAPPGTFSTREEEAEAGRAALALLERFYDSFDAGVVPLSRERWLSARLSNGVEVFTRADRIDGEPAGAAVEVVDYKTGKFELESPDLVREPAVQVLALAAGDEYRRRVMRVRYLYLASGHEARWEPESEDLAAARERLVKATDIMLADRDFEAYPGEQCRFCPWSHICPSAGRVEPKDLEVPDDLAF